MLSREEIKRFRQIVAEGDNISLPGQELILDAAERGLDAENLLATFTIQDRIRGYPTGPEWMELITAAREFMERR